MSKRTPGSFDDAYQNLAIFGDRGFSFIIPDDELDQLPIHVELLIEAADGINVLVHEADDELVAPCRINAAKRGAIFLQAMAAEMVRRLRFAKEAA
jgi:hypothetical protein